MHPAEEYIADIRSGEIPACQFIKWAVDRHVNDLERSEDEDYPFYFDEDAAQWYIDLFHFMILYEGEAAGEPFDLSELGWIQFQLWCIFGWKKKKNGMRRFRKAFVMVAKKNIKTTFAACLGLIMLMFDGEAGAQVYSAASNAKQAKICFRAAREIAKKSPALRQRLEVLSHNISHVKSASFFEYISSQSAQTKDGLNPHCSIIDEYHAHPDNEVHDVLDSATAARQQPLVYIISTAGFNVSGPCKEMQDYCEKVLNPDSPIEDDSLFALIFTLDKDDDWTDEANWMKANPSLGVSVKYDDLRAKAQTAKQLPTQMNNFLTKHMNIWTDSKEAFVTEKKWADCGTKKLEPVMPNLLKILNRYKGRRAYGGLDLGSVSDFTANLWAIEPEEEGQKWDILSLFWIPEDTIQERKNKEMVSKWVRDGHIGTTPGDYTDHKFTRETIKVVAEHLEIAELAYDRYKMTEMVTDLMEAGIEMTPFGQGFVSMSPAIDYLETLILSSEIEHFNNPVLSWMMGNITIKKDPAGNRKFDKAASQDKIDGAVALAMALGRGMLQEGETYGEWDEFIVI